MVKLTAFEGPPPGEGVTTVTWATPAMAISDAGTETESWRVVALKVVVSCVLFQ